MKHLLLVLFSAIIVITACHKDKYMISDVQGSVLLYDETGKLLEASGVKVTLSGINDSAYTDSNGYYIMEDIPAGTYVMTFSKEGYPTQKIYNMQVLGNGQTTRYIETIGIMHYPTTTIDNFRDTVINSFLTDVKADINWNGITKEIPIIMYASHSKNVSLSNYETKELLFTDKDYIMLDRDFFNIERNMYVVFYSCSYSSYFMWTDEDSVKVKNNHFFIFPRNEFGEYYNPYYKKISDEYFYQ